MRRSLRKGRIALHSIMGIAFVGELVYLHGKGVTLVPNTLELDLNMVPKRAWQGSDASDFMAGLRIIVSCPTILNVNS